MGGKHISALQNTGIHIVGIYDQNVSTSFSVARQFELSEHVVFEDFRKMLTSTKPDNVIVSTTADSHAEYVIGSANLGVKRVLCEKPMATGLGATRKMIEACVQSGTALHINHQIRYSQRFVEIQSLVDSNIIGTVSSINVVAGNIGLAMGVSHYIDFCQLIFDEPWSSVMFSRDLDGPPNPRGSQFTDPSGVLVARTNSGRTASVSFKSNQGHGLQTTLAGAWGFINSNDLSGQITAQSRQETDRDLPSTRYGTDFLQKQILVGIEDVTQLTNRLWLEILSGSKSVPSVSEVREIMKVLVGAEVSSRSGSSWVRIADIADEKLDFPWA